MKMNITDLGNVYDEFQNLVPLFDTAFTETLNGNMYCSAALLQCFHDRFHDLVMAVEKTVESKEAAA